MRCTCDSVGGVGTSLSCVAESLVVSWGNSSLDYGDAAMMTLVYVAPLCELNHGWLVIRPRGETTRQWNKLT